MELHAQQPRPALVALSAPRILVIRPRKIGDVVLTTPLLRALKHAYPDCPLSFLAESVCGDVLAPAR